jgi:hypothetical protein
MPTGLPDPRASASTEALALRSLSRARLATAPAFDAFVRCLALPEGAVARWAAGGLLRRVSCHPTLGAGPPTDVLSLSPKGAKALSASAGKPVPCVTAARLRRSGQKLLHDAGMGDALLAFLALAAQGRLDLKAATADTSLLGTSAALPGPPPERVPLQPDGYVRWSSSRGPRGLLVEYDRGTVGVGRMAKKYAAYLAWSKQGGPERAFAVKGLRVLTLVPDARRLGRLRAAALEAGGGRRAGLLLFALASDVSPAAPGRLREPLAWLPGSETPEPIVAP